MQKIQLISNARVSRISSLSESPPISVDRSDFIKEPFELHLALAAFNRKRLNPGEPSVDWQADICNAISIQIAEGQFLEQERNKIRSLATVTTWRHLCLNLVSEW